MGNGRETPSSKEDYPSWKFDEVDPADRYDGVRTWTKAVSLQRNEEYLISPHVSVIRVGFGWVTGADVDVSLVLFDEELSPVDTVWYKKPQSMCGSVKHYGDNTPAATSGDDKVISVQLSKIPLIVHHLLFSLCLDSEDWSLDDVKPSYVRMLHSSELYREKEMFRFPLTELSGHVTIVGALTRKGPLWSFKALETPATGRTAAELMKNPTDFQFLSEISTWKPVFRQITVTVLRGRNLAAKDIGLFRSPSSDPYYLMRFKKKTLKSEYKAKTLRPEWEVSSFDMGFVTEAETKRLSIEIFDRDMLSADDFMGAIAIPAHALYALGLGRHTFWVLLGDGKEKTKGEISGEVLVQFDVSECA